MRNHILEVYYDVGPVKGLTKIVANSYEAFLTESLTQDRIMRELGYKLATYYRRSFSNENAVVARTIYKKEEEDEQTVG